MIGYPPQIAMVIDVSFAVQLSTVALNQMTIAIPIHAVHKFACNIKNKQKNPPALLPMWRNVSS